MSGHSKWSNIQGKKGVADSKRRQNFTKVAKDIATIVSVTKNGDVKTNSTLATAVDKAKAFNMTKDKIQNAINRGLGIKDGSEQLVEKTYEFYGPSGSKFLVECETDNSNRTLAEMKVVANNMNLKIANEGSISWEFEEVGKIMLETENINLDEIPSEILEVEGLKDFNLDDKIITLIFERANLSTARETLSKNSDFKIVSLEIVKLPKEKINSQEEFSEIEDIFYENGAVTNVWKNY